MNRTTIRSAFALVTTLSACATPATRSDPETPAPTTPIAGDPPGHSHAGPSWTLASTAKGAVLFGDLGEHTRKVTTSSKEAQAFFDQGLALAYGFNHDEAARSFAKAAELDPKCAMCFWGAAYTLGPNYNIPMLPERAEAAWDAIGRAQAAAKAATPVEAALVAALARRYKGPEYVDPVAMQAFNVAYAEAMRDVAAKFPADDDVQALFAEALMNTNPWKLWAADGKAMPGTDEIVKTLELVLARAPKHPGANHFYIHAVEASNDPGRAIASADLLGTLVPGAGHIVHMPAHIYQRVGRYEDAAEVNRRAIVVDERYLAKVTPPGYYPFYLGHNYGFLAYAASMLGKGEESLAAARKSAMQIPKDVVCGMPGMDFFLSEPLFVMVRFGKWDDILAEKKPETKYATLVALWHHARGMALAATGKPADAKAEAAAIRTIAKSIPEGQLADLNSAHDVLELSALVIEARAAEVEHAADAIARWEQAVALEDRLGYAEPADWFYPLRHYRGAALLDAGRAKDAEAVYRADLLRNPDNGWALFGVWRSLVAQKKKGGAKTAEKAFRAAWRAADVQLERTAF
jgi:tetratricopeptide (TPR) repeat protein